MVEVGKTDEVDTSDTCAKVVVEIVLAEPLEAVLELARQSVESVFHGANQDVSTGGVEDGVQVESQLVTWLVFAGGRHGSALTVMFPSSCIEIGGIGQARSGR